MPNPVKRRQRAAKRFEQALAEDVGGRRVFLSGAGMDKADVRRTATFTRQGDKIVRTAALPLRLEAKTTSAPFYSFTLTGWTALVRTAQAAGEHPVFAIRFLPKQGEVAIIKTSLMLMLGIPEPYDATARELKRSMRLRPGESGLLNIRRGNSREYLCLLPYDTFLEKLHEYNQGR